MPICLSGHRCHFMSKQAVRYISVKYTCVTVMHHFTMCITVVIIVFMIIIMLPQQNIVKAYYCILVLQLLSFCMKLYVSQIQSSMHLYPTRYFCSKSFLDPMYWLFNKYDNGCLQIVAQLFIVANLTISICELTQFILL